MKDIDDLLNEIENASTAEVKSKSKKKKGKVEEVIFPDEGVELSTDKIVKVVEAIKLGDPKKAEENVKNALEDEIKTESVVKVVDEEKAKKKRKKKKKKASEKKEGEEDFEKDATDLEKNINKYRNIFDFSSLNITDSRFQDNSIFRILKNWEDKPWHQT